MSGEACAISGAHHLDRSDLQQRTEHVGGTTMLDNPTVNDTVKVDAGEHHRLPGWLDAKPRSFVRPFCRNARNHPFAFSNLSFDLQVKIWIRLPNTEDMFLGSFNPDDMPLAIDNLGVSGGDKTLNQINIPRVDDLLIEPSNE